MLDSSVLAIVTPIIDCPASTPTAVQADGAVQDTVLSAQEKDAG